MSLDTTRKNTPSPKHARDLSGLAGFDDVNTAKSSPDPIDAIDGDGLTLISPAAGADENSRQGANGQNEPRKRGLKPWVVPVAILAVLAAVYGGGVYVFSGRCLPNTTVDGVDCSLKSASELAAFIESQTDGYTLTVSGDDVDLTLAAADIDLGYDGDAYAGEVLSASSPWAWPLEVTKSRSINLNKKVSYDAKKVAEAVAPFVEQSKQAAKAAEQEAKIVYDAAQGGFVLENGVSTRVLNGDSAAARICAALDALKPTLELGDDCMESGDDFSQAIANANSYLAAAPTLTLAGSTVCEISPDLIASWLKIDDGLGISFDDNAITKWCQTDLSKQCDTVGTTRTYTRPDGKTVQVSGGSYGWNINGAETAAKIRETLQSGQKTTVDIPAYSQAASYAPANGGKDWGNRFIDVDLTEQHARMYDASGSLIWETDIVTGDAAKGYNTPCGVYTMNSYRAQGNVELRGKIDPETNEPEYVSHVDYWMPFIGNSYALHDADWRAKFGGKIYESNGSHGCINLPAEKAKELYGLTQIGDVVVVHQ